MSATGTDVRVTVRSLPLTWAQSVRVGLARPFGQELITDVRFKAGGEYSIRGYPTEGLGPTETLGDTTRVTGGEALLVINEELRFPIRSKLKGVIFVDIGNVYRTLADYSLNDIRRVIGGGLRLATPIGPFRLEYGKVLDQKAGEPPGQLFFSIGQAF